MNRLRTGAFALLALLGGAHSVHADWLITPFVGAAVDTDTTFLDLDGVAGNPHATVGVALTRFPKGVFGIDIETSRTPSLFSGHELVDSSSVLNITGSLVIALPERWSRVVRPYALVGGGLVHVTSTDVAGVFPIDSTRPAASVGVGVWVPMTRHVGARGGVRFLRSGSESDSMEMWQTTAGVAVRF